MEIAYNALLNILCLNCNKNACLDSQVVSMIVKINVALVKVLLRYLKINLNVIYRDVYNTMEIIVQNAYIHLI